MTVQIAELRCEYMAQCPDNTELRTKGPDSPKYEDLSLQRDHLCLRGGIGCSLRDNYLTQTGERK